jgi:prepilin peptidase CpaA
MPHATPAELALLAAALVMLGAAGHDLVARTIPDALVGAAALIGLLLRVGAGDLGWALTAAALVFAAAALAWRFGALGGGDVKLLGAAALLVPPAAVPALVLAVALAGGVVAAIYLVLRPLLRLSGLRPAATPGLSLPARALRAEAWRIRRGASLPYAVAIAAGTLGTLALTGV